MSATPLRLGRADRTAARLRRIALVLVAAGVAPVARADPADDAAAPSAAAVGAGVLLVLASSRLDASTAASAQRHADGDLARAVRATGDALPFVAFGYAGWRGWLDGTAGADERQVARDAAVAGLWAVAVAQGTKLALARARPSTGLGPGHFDHAPRADSSFPSVHTALSWAVLARHAAEDTPTLYAAALLTNAARVLGRKHWLSDTTAGALLGYHVARRVARPVPRLGAAPGALQVHWGTAPRALWVQVAIPW